METYSCAQRWTIAPSLAKSYCPIMSDPILVAESKEQIFLLPKMANRHGLIAGATGTRKTGTLQTLAENVSARGVPACTGDGKGDLAGRVQPGGDDHNIH